jgi:hypothetical protein
LIESHLAALILSKWLSLCRSAKISSENLNRAGWR